MRYTGDMGLSLLDRLLSKVLINQYTNCWEFTGGKNNIGYGMIRDGKGMRTTHRVSYEEHTQTKIPKGLIVMHSCDNPCCVNPQHLTIGTHKDNSQDMLRKGRQNLTGSFGMLGKKQPRTLCVYCNTQIPNNTYALWHGDKCKQKP